MARRDRPTGAPLFDLVSYARRGPGRRDRFTAAELDQIRRTVTRAPEVMVKVLTRGAPTVANACRHANYIARGGEVELETDDGRQLAGRNPGAALIEDWNLNVPTPGSAEATARGRRFAPKPVQKLIFSMPPGTPPEKVLAAVRDLAREEFALKHRYALALHTDEAHPHVHVMVKSLSEQGVRLNIRKDLLRRWRSEFARHLRGHGVDANATERAVRGQTQKSLIDGVYRAARRGASIHLEQRAHMVVDNIMRADSATASRETPLNRTRRAVAAGYGVLASLLSVEGHSRLSDRTREFMASMPAALPEERLMRRRIMEYAREGRSRESAR